MEIIDVLNSDKQLVSIANTESNLKIWANKGYYPQNISKEIKLDSPISKIDVNTLLPKDETPITEKKIEIGEKPVNGKVRKKNK